MKKLSTGRLQRAKNRTSHTTIFKANVITSLHNSGHRAVPPSRSVKAVVFTAVATEIRDWCHSLVCLWCITDGACMTEQHPINASAMRILTCDLIGCGSLAMTRNKGRLPRSCHLVLQGTLQAVVHFLRLDEEAKSFS